MGHVRSLTRALVAVAALGHAGGCITITPAEKPKPADAAKPESGVVQAAAKSATPAPAAKPAGPTVTVSMPKINLTTEKKVAPTEITLAWSRRVEHLPDPAKDGAMGPGLVGQLFLYGAGPSGPVPATADGKLTIALYHEVADIGMPPRSVFLGQWVFEKDVLKTLVFMDERWGKHYQVFLPWPTYTPDVTKIKLTAKFEPENGYPLYTPAAVITIDTSVPGSNFSASSSSVPLNTLPPGTQLGAPPVTGPTDPAALPPPKPLPPAVSAPSGLLPPQAWR